MSTIDSAAHSIKNDKHRMPCKGTMFINKAKDGKNNICGTNIYNLRKALKISQRELADRMQIEGLDIDKNAIQRMEAGKRFVTDIELVILSKVLKSSLDNLLL